MTSFKGPKKVLRKIWLEIKDKQDSLKDREMKKHEPIDEAGPQRSREGMHMAMCPEGRGRKQQGEVRYRLCSIWNDKIRKNSLFENKSWIMSNT